MSITPIEQIERERAESRKFREELRRTELMDNYLLCCFATTVTMLVFIVGLFVGVSAYNLIKYGELRRTIHVEFAK